MPCTRCMPSRPFSSAAEWHAWLPGGVAAAAAELGALLGVPAEKAERIASHMAMENRLQVSQHEST